MDYIEVSRKISIDELKTEIFARLSAFEYLPADYFISSDFSMFFFMNANEIKNLVEHLITSLKDVRCDV